MAIIEQKPDGVYESKADNLKEIDWVKLQTQNALEGLKAELKAAGIGDVNDFYETKSDGTVVYRMGVVEKYLETLKGKKWADLNKENVGAWITAVQIALESQGYDVGKIDGILGKQTAAAVREFQSKNGLKVDGAPGKDTISKLLERMGAPVETPVETPTETPVETPTETPVETPVETPTETPVETQSEDMVDLVERLELNDGYPRYFYTGKVDDDGKPHGEGIVEFKYMKNENKFGGIREHGRIVECTSYDNTIKVKYNAEGDAIFETKSGKTLKVENKNTEHVGRTASIINYIFKAIRDSGKKFDHFYMNHDHHLRVKYKDGSYKKVLSSAHFAMKVDYEEDLVGWLNEYSKEVEK